MEAVLNTPFDQERFLDFLLHFATMQTSVGVQTSRIVLNTTRIAEALSAQRGYIDYTTLPRKGYTLRVPLTCAYDYGPYSS